MKIWHDYINKIDPSVNPEAVLDVADDLYRYFSEMSREQWVECVNIVKHGW